MASEGIFRAFQPLLPVFTALFRLLTWEKERWKKLRAGTAFIHATALSLSLSLAISLSLSPGHGDVSPYSLSLSLFALLCLGLEAPAVLTPRALGASRPTLLTGGAQLYGGHMDQTEW